jgi:glutathione S-transferase
MITLYDYELSGNCYKVRLMLAFLGLEYVRRPINFYPGREHKSPGFLALNPLGQVPVIDDGGFVLRDAQAILVYLASRYDASALWYPRGDPKLLGDMTQWLVFADAVTGTASLARLHDALFYEADIDACRAGAHRLFRVLDRHLWFAERRAAGWLCEAAHPTIADLAVFPYVQLSEEGGISRRDYPAIRRWTDRIRSLPGFTVMPGIFALPATVGAVEIGNQAAAASRLTDLSQGMVP